MTRNVLVVDDDPATVEALALVLELEGFAVERAGGVDEALEAARRTRPNAVVCDLALGLGGDGCAVARAVRAEPSLAGTQLLALSGTDDAESKARAHDAGFEQVLVKPVDAAVLVRHLSAAHGS
jgi:DNA-binding response OmpR family regulator